MSECRKSSSTEGCRVTAKMKAEWSNKLEAAGYLVCEMPDCSQTYVTITNFLTHYKYCVGRKELQHCIYCDSLIFSSDKAIHHMEVEHPEKVEEYKAQFPEKTSRYNEVSLPSQFTAAEDENVALNEEIMEQPMTKSRKHKVSSKDKVLSKPAIFKHKIQPIQNASTENNFKHCVRFSNIVDTINSVDRATNLNSQNKGKNKKRGPKEQVLNECIISREKYFEDSESPKDSKKVHQINTKARVVLDMDQHKCYKRYKEYLNETRDWSSECRTYTLSCVSDASSDSLCLGVSQNEYTTHHMNETIESQSISLNSSDNQTNTFVPYSQTLGITEANQFISPINIQLDDSVNKPLISASCSENEKFQISSNEITPSEHPINSTENSHIFEPFVKSKTDASHRECSNLYDKVKNRKTPRSKYVKLKNFITYGMAVPSHYSKSLETIAVCSSLSSSLKQNRDKRNSTVNGTNPFVDGENISFKQDIKEDSINLHGNLIISHSDLTKGKKGRCPAAKPNLPDQVKDTSDSKHKTERSQKMLKKYSSTLLKRIKSNVKNRHQTLPVVNKKSKFVTNSRKNVKSSSFNFRNSFLKNISKRESKHRFLKKRGKNIQKTNLKLDVMAGNNQKVQKNVKSSFLAVNRIIKMQEMDVEVNSADESVIQCQENIDNHLSCGDESNNNFHIQSLVFENHLNANVNSIIPEVGVINSDIKHFPQYHADQHQQNQTNYTATSEEIVRVENSPVTLGIDHPAENQETGNAILEMTSIVEHTFESLEIEHSGAYQIIEKESLGDSSNVEKVIECHVSHSKLQQKTVTQDFGSVREIPLKLHETDHSGTNNKTKIVPSKASLCVENGTISNKLVCFEADQEVSNATLEETSDIKIGLRSHKMNQPTNQKRKNDILNLTSSVDTVSECVQVQLSDTNQRTEIPSLGVTCNAKNTSVSHKIDQTHEKTSLEETVMVKNDCMSQEINNFKVNELGAENATPEVISALKNVFRSHHIDNFEVNKKEDHVTPVVKVKRSRGRPRKYCHEDPTPHASGLHSFLQNTSNTDNMHEIKGDTKRIQSKAQTVCHVTDKNKQSSPLRRSNRLKKSNGLRCYEDDSKTNQTTEIIASKLTSAVDKDTNSYVHLPKTDQKIGLCSSTILSDVENVHVSLQSDNLKVNKMAEKVNVPFHKLNGCRSYKINHSEVNEGGADAASKTSCVSGSHRTDYSEANQKIENVTPEGKVKRPRGRPRKYLNNESTPNIPMVLASLQSPSNINKVDETMATCYSKGTPSEVENPNYITRENKCASAVSKSRRKKCKLIEDEIFQSPKFETKKDFETTSVIQTGRRGRPRKIHTEDSVVNVLDRKTNFAREESFQVEVASDEKEFSKYSPTGRSRKFLKNENLKSGFDRSCSLNSLSRSVKNKSELPKINRKEREKLKYSLKEKKSGENVNQSYVEGGTIVLPLKKRKLKFIEKDFFMFEKICSTNTRKNVDNSTTILDVMENMVKRECDSGDKITDNRNEQKSQNLRNHRNIRVLCSRKKRISSCDPEFKRSKNAHRRKDKSYTPAATCQISYSDTLESEEEAAGAEKDYFEAKDQNYFPKGQSNTSATNRRLSGKSSTRSKELRHAALKNSFQLPESVLENFKPQKHTWKRLRKKEYYDCFPPMRFSPYFKTKTTWNGSETNWSSLSAFESAPIDKESCHCTFFTGGPVSCSAWCPTPVIDTKVQYIALAVSCSLETYDSYVHTDSKKGLLQIWKVGMLHKKVLESKPTMELSIAHSYGVITDIAWCPNGCWEDPSTECLENMLPRLGMLAVACSDSNVRVYCIPHSGHLMNGSDFPIYEACPSIVLQTPHGEICSATRKSMCTSLSWQKSDNCEKVAAGYGNGMICLWNISSAATILVSRENNQTKIRPYLVFNAHGTPVTSVSFAPFSEGRFLVSSSFDKTLKFWDLLDISLPFSAVKKGPAQCAEWANHYCGAFASLNNGMNCFKGSSFFKECGTEILPFRLLANRSCFVTKSTVSQFLEAQAIADIAGSVSVSFIYDPLKEHHKSPHYFHRPVYVTETVAVEGIMEKIAFSSYPESGNCFAVIQDMKNVVSVMKNVTEMCVREKDLDVDSRIKSKEQETQRPRSSNSAENIVESQWSNINTEDLPHISVNNNLPTAKSFMKLNESNQRGNQNNCQMSLMQSLEDKKLLEEDYDDELMLLVSSESSNSEKEIDSNDEKVTHLYSFDSKSSLSGDSFMSECSLDRNISTSPFSSVSYVSESSSDSKSSDQEQNNTVLCTSHENNAVGGSSKPPLLPSGLLSLISEISQDLCYRKDSSGDLESDSISSNLLDLQKSVVSSNDQAEKFKIALPFIEENVPVSDCEVTNFSLETPLSLSSEPNKMESLDISKQFPTISDEMPSETHSNVSNNIVSCNADFTDTSENSQKYVLDTRDVLSINKSCDISSCSSVISKNDVNISYTEFIENSANSKAVCDNRYLEKNVQSDCNMTDVLSDIKENISDSQKVQDIFVDRVDYNNNKENRSSSIENHPVTDNRNLFPTRFSYENVISHYGLVFKDMNTADFESVEDASLVEGDSLLPEEYNLASVKTVSWNPNYGCHFWLFSAGQSGFARISYISNINN